MNFKIPPTNTGHFHLSNHPYQIQNVQSNPQTTDIWSKKLNVTWHLSNHKEAKAKMIIVIQITLNENLSKDKLNLSSCNFFWQFMYYNSIVDFVYLLMGLILLKIHYYTSHTFPSSVYLTYYWYVSILMCNLCRMYYVVMFDFNHNMFQEENMEAKIFFLRLKLFKPCYGINPGFKTNKISGTASKCHLKKTYKK